ncbi:phosphate signaling complex protein PhoU [Paraburkholderia sp. BR14263]|uniref:phosphate signaling complex protein PhoU n=1 Tax=unclassified Paraburkholderia TaxID=2615204 RepID=UPI0034CF2C8A
MPEKHLSSGFDADLTLASTRLLEMGGLVELQIARALSLLHAFDPDVVYAVLESEQRLNLMELEIDGEVSNVIARRQPAARDLRLLLAISKCTTNLERAGDEARKVAKRIRRIQANSEAPVIGIVEIKTSAEMAMSLLHGALDAFARMDSAAAAHLVRDDVAIDNEFRAFTRGLIAEMTADPRVVSTGLDYMVIAKAIERIGDHAKNIAEFVVYVVKGTDVRHVPAAQLEHEASS